MTDTVEISTDKSRLDVPMIHWFLSEESYWAKNIPLDMVQRSIDNSLCFGVYVGEQQVGFARVITDHTTMAYVSDVFILPSHRGRGLSKQLMQHIIDEPALQGLRRWILVTDDAHALYARFGFVNPEEPQTYMHRRLISRY